MLDIITRAGCFVAIIVMGYILRKKNFFGEEAFDVLSKIVIKITLPAAIISSFAGKEIDFSLLSLALIGFGGDVLYMILGYVSNLRRGKEQQAFDLLNLSGYNIGNFTLPFVQSFLGPVGVITTSLFDTGNASICLGTACGIAASVKNGQKFSVTKILKKMAQSVAFDCYVIMIFMQLFRISIPGPIVSFAEIIGNSNAFLAMFMIGVGFKLSGDLSQKKTIIRILAIRYGVSILLAAGCYFLLPFALEVRQTLVILLFSPISSAVPAFTKEIDGDVGLSSAVNSISIIISIICIVGLLLIML